MIPKCPQCSSEYTYEDGENFVCPECAHEWPQQEVVEEKVYKDAFGNILKDGDDVTTIKDLKINGGPQAIKVGAKAKNIKLGEFKDNHDISCKIQGYGQMYLKTSVVKKN